MFTYSVAECNRVLFDLAAASSPVYLVLKYRADLNLTYVHSVHPVKADADAIAVALNV